MSEKRNAPVEAATSGKGRMDGAANSSAYESIIAGLFGQVCTRILKLNERKCADGYGCYELDISDACIGVYYFDQNEHRSVFHLFRSEIKEIGILTALRSLLEILDGEGDAE